MLLLEYAAGVGAAMLIAGIAGMAAALAGISIYDRHQIPAWDSTLDLMADRTCTVCGGRHCAGCEAPARTMATAYSHTPRHDWDEVPPSLRPLAEMLPVGLRAVVIARAVGPRWWPHPRTAAAWHVWASQRLGRPVQVGLGRAIGGVA